MPHGNDLIYCEIRQTTNLDCALPFVSLTPEQTSPDPKLNLEFAKCSYCSKAFNPDNYILGYPYTAIKLPQEGGVLKE